MLLFEAPEVAVPRKIEEKNTNADAVKGMLNRVSGLTNLDFEPAAEIGFRARPTELSRPNGVHLSAAKHRRQSDVMFFKADTTEHREKLKTIFPYILGAVTGPVLEARFELDRLARNLRRKESDFRAITDASRCMETEARGWLRQALNSGSRRRTIPQKIGPASSTCSPCSAEQCQSSGSKPRWHRGRAETIAGPCAEEAAVAARYGAPPAFERTPSPVGK